MRKERVFIFGIVLIIVFAACGGGKKESGGENATLKEEKMISESFLGSWCGNDIAVIDQGTKFQLDFEEEITYHAGGPFEEKLTYKVISVNEIELYFDFTMGSSSFMEASNGEKKNEKGCADPVMKCKLISETEMEVQTFKDKCGQVPEDITITLNKLDDREFCSFADYEEDYADDPFVAVVGYLDSEELMALFGKREPEDITDFFLLIPDDDCFGLTVDERKKMVQGERLDGWSQMAIGEKDIKNRYLNLSGAFEGKWEMYAEEVEDVWMVAVNVQFCGPFCITHLGDSFLYENRRLMKVSYANLAGYQNFWPELFFDFDKLTSEQIDKVEEIWVDDSSAILFDLPRDGKTITMYVDNLPYLEEDIPEEAFKVVKTEMWK